MTITLLLGVLLTAGPGHADITALSTNPDKAVVEAATQHLRGLEELGFGSIPKAKREIVLDSAPPRGDGSYPCGGDCVAEGRILPPWVMAALKLRNTSAERQTFSWATVCSPCDTHLLVEDDLHQALLQATDPSLGELRGMAVNYLSTFETAFPTSRGWLRAYLPAYSPDRTAAVFRAWVGPSPHGSLATLYLQLERGRWHVLWCDILHFA